MLLPYFFINSFDNSNTIVLSEETSKHCIQVLRMKEDEHLQLTDGNGNLIIGRIINPDKKHCAVAVEEKKTIDQKTKKIFIAISLLKNATRFEWFLEKGTEIGVSGIFPMICERTECQRFRYERMKNILVAAMLQSEQAWLPFLHEPQSFEKTVSSFCHDQRLIAHCENDESKNNIAFKAVSNETIVLIGPEGDFTRDEIDLAVKYKFQSVSLGHTRLRSETAAIVAATLLANGPYKTIP